MRQRTFSSVGFERHGKQTRRQRFLAEMDTIVPWRKLYRLIEPHYPKGDRGRPPIGIDRMLRIYFLQVWFNLSDPAAEDALYDSTAMRDFVGIDLGREPAPDENRGRDARYRAPPAQIRTGPIKASGSYLGCLTAKRVLGNGWRTRGKGSQSLAIFVMRSHVMPSFWLRRRSVRRQRSVT